MARSERITVVAGIPPGPSGTGRMMSQLMDAAGRQRSPVRFVHKVRSGSIRSAIKAGKYGVGFRAGLAYFAGQAVFYLRCLILLAGGRGKLLLMHPQTIGFRLTNLFLQRWPVGKIHIYVLDSSYFCVRSYNHIPGETKPCLSCLGGNFDARDKAGCEPFPVKDRRAAAYTRELLAAGGAGNVRFLSQNETQMRYISSHFGPRAPVEVVGLWGSDWVEPFDAFEARGVGAVSDSGPIVIHSFYVPAKGADWFLELARHCPEWAFFCPFPRARTIIDAPPNVTFKLLTWETGLRDILSSARLVIVPSLWSAPIEGALVKSLVASRRVATIDNESAFQVELPGDVVLRLSGDPALAAGQLRAALQSGWGPSPEGLRDWATDFRRSNEVFADRLLAAVGSA